MFYKTLGGEGGNSVEWIRERAQLLLAAFESKILLRYYGEAKKKER